MKDKNLNDENLILSEDTDTVTDDKLNDDNPFKELKNLISKDDIDVKTILTDEQSIITHKLNTLEQMFRMEKSKSGNKCAEMLKFFSNRYMILAINKNGISRTQFIDALHKGEDKIQQAKQLKITNGVMQL